MDPVRLAAEIVHVGGAFAWGGALLATALGSPRRAWLVLASTLSVVAGAWLMWEVTDGFVYAYLRTANGVVLVGGAGLGVLAWLHTLAMSVRSEATPAAARAGLMMISVALVAMAAWPYV